MDYVNGHCGPTQSRVLELQTKMGTMCTDMDSCNVRVKEYKEAMDEALGTGGKGDLKHQIMAEVRRAVQALTATLGGYERDNQARSKKADQNV